MRIRVQAQDRRSQWRVSKLWLHGYFFILIGIRYVKLSLPEGVKEDGSQLSELQTKFEEILVEHGLLQPAEEASARSRIKAAIAS